MNKLTQQQKVDIGLSISLLIICIWTVLAIRDNSEIKEVNLSNSQLMCPKHGTKFQWYFVLKNEKYYFGRTYDSCDEFSDAMVGKEVIGSYLVKNMSIIDLSLDGKFVKETSRTKLVYMGAFLAFFVFALGRKPIQRLVNKYV
jgi:hypothetical protein